VTRHLVAGIALLIAATPAAAQAPPGGPGRPERGPRDEAFKMIDAYIMSNLQESLGLTDEQFVKLLPLVKKLQTDRRSWVHRRQHTLRQMRRLLRSGSATEAQVTEQLRHLKAIEAEEPGRTLQNVQAIDAVLNPIQQAKFRVLEVEVERKIRELMSELRARRGLRGEPSDDDEPPPHP
jgi:Spy/CpxP family protein refolding chaperone